MERLIPDGCPVYVHSIKEQGIITESMAGECIAYTVQLFNGYWAACPDYDVEILH